VLGQDQPLPLIKEELIPQGHAKDDAARNANLESLDVAGVAASLLIVHTNTDKLNNYEIDNDNGIIAVGVIPQLPPHTPLIVNNTDDDDVAGSDNNNDDAESNNDNGSEVDNNNLSGEDNDDEPADSEAATNADDNQSGSDQGVQRLKCRGKGLTKKLQSIDGGKGSKEGGHAELSFTTGASSFQQTI
jgi:hypothetical protein